MTEVRHSRFFHKQEDRQRHNFPPDRIAFHPNKASKDVDALKKWSDSDHSIVDMVTLCQAIAYNNYLDEYFADKMIPVEMMQNELRIMGYPWEIKC